MDVTNIPTISSDSDVTGEPEEKQREERKRYTSQLQRRAQAHITAELGGPQGEAEIDRQVTMVVQHAMELTGARRVSLYRPNPNGRRWHIATLTEDGSFYYGQSVKEALPMPLKTYQRQRTMIVTEEQEKELGRFSLSELGCRSYLGVPVRAGDGTVAVIEAIDVAQPDHLERHADAIELAAKTLAGTLKQEVRPPISEEQREVNASMADDTVLELVLRPGGDPDDTILISPSEWAVLNHLNGERSLATVAHSAGLGLAEVATIADQLTQRGLIRPGKDARRSG